MSVPNQNNLHAASHRLRVKFLLTSLPVGGAETLLYNLVQRMDRSAFDIEVVCLKEAGEMGPQFEQHVRVHSQLLASKWDLRVAFRLCKLFTRTTDAIVTVGAGDKMFWGRLAGKLAGVPVICSALHSTGWPDGVGRLNRLLTPITDGFIACAHQHASHLIEFEKFPADRVHMVPNGVDVSRFKPDAVARDAVRRELGIRSDAELIGIVAALRPEKNHLQFALAANRVIHRRPDAHFVVVGDGPERDAIERQIKELGIVNQFHLLGSRRDTPSILAAMDVFCLTSKMEANPVSIMEALATQVPVVSPHVGSVDETVVHGKTGYLTKPLCALSTSDAILELLESPERSAEMGRAGRDLICQQWSLDAMVAGYERLLVQLYASKMRRQSGSGAAQPSDCRPGKCQRSECADCNAHSDAVVYAGPVEQEESRR